MAKFGINDILNAKTKAAGQQAQTEGYKEIYLSPYEVKAAPENTHQKLENIEELADNFLHVVILCQDLVQVKMRNLSPF